MFYKDDWQIWTSLLNIKNHLAKRYDFMLIVSGDTGSGKSVFGLQLLESWYRVVLGKDLSDEELLDHITPKYKKFAENVSKFTEFDMNILDEGSMALDSAESLNRLTKLLKKVYDVSRYKKQFTVVILPVFFRLNKNFREERLRSFVHISTRGQYRWFSKKGIMYLNGFNARRNVKSLYVAKTVFNSVFPDMNSSLFLKYDRASRLEKDEIIKDLVSEIQVENSSTKSLFELHSPAVLSKLKEGKSQNEIVDDLKISKGSVNSIVDKLRKRSLI